MTITGTDAYGAYTDTGVASKPTARADVETDIHTLVPSLTDVDTRSTLTNAQKVARATPYRPATSPR